MEEYLGRIAHSKAGHDRGLRLAVIGWADDAHVLVADGDVRKIAKPKKKKLMHLAFEKARIADIEAILALPGGTADAALRRALDQEKKEG